MSPTVQPRPSATPARASRASNLLIPGLFVGAYFAARAGLERAAPGSLAALGLALLPVPFFALLIHACVRGVRGLDELARRIQLEALAFAFPVAILVVFTVGLLDLAGFHGTNDWDPPRLWPLLLLPYWGGIVRASRRYR
jgi:hypothetical protein